MAEFEIQKGSTTPRSEQETIITYSKELDKWYLFTDNPVHARKYEQFVEPDNEMRSFKRYNENTNELIGFDGVIVGANVTISKKRQMTEEQKELARERISRAREQVSKNT